MRRIRTLVVVAFVLAGCEESRRQSPAPAPPGGQSETTGTPIPAAPRGQPRGPRVGAIASGDGVSGLSAYGGHLVFSRLEGRHYRLYHWHDGRLKALPVPARRSVFDADA